MSIVSSQQITNNGGGNGAVASTARSRTYRTGNTTMSLREGQTLKGTVTDVHGNKITLDLGDGAQFTGELTDANKYSIGQKAAFMITSLEDNTIYMQAKGDGYLLGMDDTVDQALEEAGLPKTDRNISLVQSLLDNGQSIAKDSIMDAIRLTSKFPDSSVDAVITMHRLGMEMTKESVHQFEQYKNQSHQLLYKMDSLTDSVSDMLSSIGEKVPRLSQTVGTELLELALNSDPSLEESELIASRTLPAVPEEVSDDVPSEAEITAAGEGAKEGAEEVSEQEAIKDAEEALDQITEDELLTLKNGEDTAKETTETKESFNPFARMKDVFGGLGNAAGAIKNAVASSGATNDFRTPFIHEQTGYTLSPDERKEFSSFLKDYPVSDSLREALEDGTATTRELLSELKDILKKLPDKSAGALLANKEFNALVKSQFMNNWTVSPENLKEEGAMKKLYEKMSEQFDALEHFSEETLGKNLFTGLSNTASDMSGNLDFMNTLNETFQYMQLPVKLANQNAHGDLYVMTKKKSLREHPDKLKAVLHLEMDHLGTLDIHITKENTSVTAAFYMDNPKTEALFKRNIDLLKDKINEQGFAFNASMNPKEKDVDIVKDFISAEAPVSSIQRYNFDLRA